MDACWAKDQPVPYLALAKTLEAIEQTSARLKIVETLANYFRSVIALTPEDLLPSVYMCLNQLAPAYHSLELGEVVITIMFENIVLLFVCRDLAPATARECINLRGHPQA